MFEFKYIQYPNRQTQYINHKFLCSSLKELIILSSLESTDIFVNINSTFLVLFPLVWQWYKPFLVLLRMRLVMGKIAELLALRMSYFFHFSEAVINYSSASLASHFILMDVLLRVTIIMSHHKKTVFFLPLLIMVAWVCIFISGNVQCLFLQW